MSEEVYALVSLPSMHTGFCAMKFVVLMLLISNFLAVNSSEQKTVCSQSSQLVKYYSMFCFKLLLAKWYSIQDRPEIVCI